MSSNKGTLTSLSSSVHKRVALAMSKGRPGSLSVPTFRFKPNTEEVTTEEAVQEDPSAEDSGRSAASSPPSSPSSVSKMSGTSAKKSARTVSLDGDSPEGADTSNWSFLNEIKDKITRTVEENLNRFDSIIGNTSKAKATDPMAVMGAVEAAEEGTGDASCEEAAVEVLPDVDACGIKETTGKVEQAYFVDLEVQPPTEVRQRKKADAAGSDSNPSSPMRFSDLTKLSQSCSLEENVMPEEEEEGQSAEPSVRVASADSEPPRAPESFGRTILKRLRLTKRNVFVIVSLILYRIFSISPFVDGFLAGVCVAALLVYAWHRLTQPVSRQPSAASPSVPLQAAFHGEAASTVQKAWMNELLAPPYSPESFHVNQTQSVLVRLDGSTLRISYTKGRIPKRAMWNEPNFEPAPIYQRIYELEGATLRLLPEGLARKRHWSRKYPIEIQLLDGPCCRESDAPAHLAKDDPKTILLFARTGRAKEEWFHLLEAASEGQAKDSDAGQEKMRSSLAYNVFMNRLIPSPSREAVSVAVAASDTPSDPPSPFVEIPSEFSSPVHAEGSAWLNALLGRCFWDFMRDPEWANLVRQKIQRKLATIRVPSFIEELRLSDIELGTQLPQFGRVTAPTLDGKGLWMDVRVTYYGSFRMTLETKLNLMKMKKLATTQQQASDEGRSSSPSESTQQRLSSLYDDAAEETGESSSDDEAKEQGESVAEDAGSRSGTTGRKILRIVDSIAQSRYFQQATEYKYVKKAMEGVSTPLILTVELVSLDGVLAINVPPPPSDRLWYGFRGNPSLSLVAKPKVGEIELQFSHIIEWIQNKLILELQRILILPNMDDVINPISSTGLVLSKQSSSVSPRDATTPTSSPAKD